MSYYFISYSSKNKDMATLILNKLISRDIRGWMDSGEIEYQQNMENTIKSAIESTDGYIILLSKEYFNSKKWCLLELDSIINRIKKNAKLKVIPIFLESKDIIEKSINDSKAKDLFDKITKFRGFEFCNIKSGFNEFGEYLDKLEDNKFYIETEDYLIYWGVEYGTKNECYKEMAYYYNIDMVHWDTGRKYVVLGKIEITITDKNLIENSDTTKKNVLINEALFYYINREKELFRVTFENNFPKREYRTIVCKGIPLYMSFTTKVIGIFPLNKSIMINYNDLLCKICK